MLLLNSIEMRHDVTTLAYRTRRWLDRVLARVLRYPGPSHTSTLEGSAKEAELNGASPGQALSTTSTGQSRVFPGGWLSLYTMVRNISLFMARTSLLREVWLLFGAFFDP